MALTGLTNLQPLHVHSIGIGTFDNTVSVGGTLTYEDVTNVDAIGVITARSGINVSGGQLDVGSNIKIGNAGVVTATSFVGSGANLTGITQTTINNNAANKVIMGSNTANTLEAVAKSTLFGNLNHGQNFLDDQNLVFGDASDMILIHTSSGAKSRLRNTNDSGSLDIESTLTRFLNKDGSTEKLRITSAGNVGINEVNPQQQLHVHDDTTYHGIFVNGSAAPRITFARQTTTTGEWSVGVDGTNGNNFAINNSGDNSNNKILISSSQVSLFGHVGVPNGNIIMGSTRGIDFSATADASLMQYAGTGADPSTDSEVLSDYEHGTWTPRIRAYDHTGNAGWGTLKYTDGTDVTGVGRYVKVGNHVWAGFKIESGSKTFDSNWTYFSIDSTPYGANNYDKASGSLYVSQTNFFTDSNSHIGGFVHGGESYMVVNKPNGHTNAQLNTSNNNRYCYGHISIYSSRY